MFSALKARINTIIGGLQKEITATDITGNKFGIDTCINDSAGTPIILNSNGHLDAVNHAHPDSGMLNFFVAGISASQDFIIIDISDTTNYPHVSTNHAHLEFVNISIDSDSSGDYLISLGYLENVDDTNGDFTSLWEVSGTRKTGNNFNAYYNLYPNGPKTTSVSVVSANKSLNDTAFQTDVNLASSLDASTADTPSGNNDLVLRITRNAGTFNVAVQLAYHSH